MRLRTMVLMTTLAFTGLSVAGAPAATLWTTPAHTTYAGLFGFAATSQSTTITGAFGTPLANCPDSTIHIDTIFRNSMANVALRSDSVTFSSCSPTPVKATFNFLGLWTLFITGNSTTSGTSTCWPSTMTNIALDVGPTRSVGDLTTGVTACQPTAGTSPVTVRLSNAGTLSTGVRIDAAFTLTGAAATFSLTN